MSDAEQVRKALRKKAPPEGEPCYLSTGSTLLNLELSGRPDGGYLAGKYYLFVGESASGKSWAALTAMAEAAINPAFASYRFVYDNPEDGILMDLRRYFGANLADRIETQTSSSVEEFYYSVDDLLEEKIPFIYVLDSMDGLSAEDDEDQFDKRKKAHRSGKKETPGSYGTAKAKANSQGLRLLVDGLKKTGSILIIIAQTRMNIGFGSQFNPKTRSGGTSLRFYATNELWFATKEKLTRRALGKERHVGSLLKISIKKNRQSGREGSVEIPIYHSSGLDDLGSLVEFLIEEGAWTGKEKTVDAPDFNFKGKKEELIAKVQEERLEASLISAASNLWRKIEVESRVTRRSKYG